MYCRSLRQIEPAQRAIEMLSRADAHQAAVAREELQGGVVTPLPEAQRVSTERIHEQMLAILAPIKDKLKKKDAQLFFKDVQHTNPQNMQQMSGTCLCCPMIVNSTGGERFGAHLLKCALVPADVKAAFKARAQQAH